MTGLWPAPGQVDVWRWRIDEVIPADGRPGFPLTAEEHRQWAGLRRPTDRHRFLASRLTQYAVGEYYTGRPVRISRRCTWCAQAHGRPSWHTDDGPESTGLLDYSVSHAGSELVIAVVADAAVGVDVERPDAATDLEMTREVLTTGEYAELAGQPPADRSDTFLRWWTRKEAAAKAAGAGLMADLGVVDVRRGTATVPVGPNGSLLVHLTDLTASPDHVASLACSVPVTVRAMSNFSQFRFEQSRPGLG